MLRGRPLLEWAVDAVAAAGCAPIVVVLPRGLDESPPELASLYPQVVFATGGDTRQASVGAGVALINADVVVVHDAARPLATKDLVQEVVETLRSNDVDAVVPGIPMDETIKEVGSDDRVLRTVDRSSLWRVQTPAAFRTAVLKAAHARADAESFVGTDESQLVERFVDGRIKIIPGRRDNLKVTFPNDLAVAEAMLEGLR